LSIASCVLFVSCFLYLVSFNTTRAQAYSFDVAISSLSGAQQTQETFILPFDKIQSIASLDLGNDGTSELVIGSPQGFEPRVYLLRQDGSLINSWLAYDANFRGGVEVASGDLDGDELPEIITAPAAEGGPHVRIFDGYGNPKINPGFFADKKDYRGGVLLDTIQDPKTKNAAIVTIAKNANQPIAKFYTNDGTEIKSIPLPPETGELLSISRIDLGGDGFDEVLIASRDQENMDALRIFRADGSLVNSFKINNSGFFAARASQKEHDKGEQIVISYEKSASDIYNGYGDYMQKPISLTKPGGTITLASSRNGSPKLLVIEKMIKTLEREDKTIIIDLSEQTLSNYEGGFRIATRLVSTGKPGYKTPTGEFSINGKIDRAYSQTYKLYMPYWMSFTYRGHGIHELPEWANGYKEGENHLGIPVSHGCVRLGVGPAGELYNWAEVGTAVIVQK